MPPLSTIPAPNGSHEAPGREAEEPREYAAPAVGAGGWLGGAQPGDPTQMLSWLISEETQFLGDQTWDRMRRDPGIAAALKTLLSGVLAKAPTIAPAREPEVGADPDEVAKNQKDYDLSQRVADYCTWLTENLDRPLKPWLWEALEGALVYGDKLCEKVYAVEPARSGSEWPGFLRYERLPFKPRSNWRYVVDGVGKVAGIAVLTVDGDWVTLPREKFAVLTLGDRDGDPRGESALMPCWKPWNLRVQLWPDWHRFARRKAEPLLVATMPPDDSLASAGAGGGETIDEILNPTGSSGSSARSEALASATEAALKRAQNGTYLYLPNGADAKYLHVDGAADVFLDAFRFTMEQILQTLLLTSTATLDSQHNSRAQSQTGEDILGTFLATARDWLCDFVEFELFYTPVLYNFGLAVAKRHTPRYVPPPVDPGEVIDLLGKLAPLGYTLAPSQLPFVDAKVGMPVRKREEIPTPEDGRALAASRLSDPPGVGGKPLPPGEGEPEPDTPDDRTTDEPEGDA